MHSSYLCLKLLLNRMNIHHISSSNLKHTNHWHISLIESDLYIHSFWEKITLRFFKILKNLWKKSTKELYFWHVIDSLISYFHICLNHFHIFSHFTFPLLCSPQDTFYNLKRLIWFNYNPHSIIITIFQRESLHSTILLTECVHLLNWKISQLKLFPW